ncbi:MAG: CBS domain-containing protein [Flavobacteriaceae bacterium]
MIQVEKYIHTRILPFEVAEKVASVQDFFINNSFSHFPITEQGVYLGCVVAEDIETFDSDKSIGDYRYTLEGFYVRENTNWLDILEQFAQNQTDIMPVLSSDNRYLGYYKLSDVVQIFSETAFLREPGGSIVVEKNMMQYSASEIAQIVESNGHKLLGMFLSEMDDKVQVYLKVNAENLNEILQTLRRYDYEILSEHSEDHYLKNLKERADYLDKYLNI